MPTVRRDNSANETKVRSPEGQVCEGQECECDFSAIGQNSEVIQIERSRSFCLQDGVFFFSLSLSVSFEREYSDSIKQRVKGGEEDVIR